MKKTKDFLLKNLKLISLSILIGSSACVIAVFAFSSPGANNPPNGNPTFWLLSGTNMYYSGGNVGIGITNPGQKFEVNGNVSSTGLCLGGACNTSWPNGDVADIKWVAKNTCPTGWIKANGAAVSRTTYASLFLAISTTYGVGDGSTTFNLPDMRGYFVRGWDDGAGVDSGRSFGTTQADDLKSHQHTTPTGNAVYTAGNGGNQYAVYVSSGAVTGFTGGTETRPKNIAFLGCIKY